MKLKVIASSSLKNSYCLYGDKENLLIEAGCNIKEITSEIGRTEFKKIKGVLISHEHKDHCRYALSYSQIGKKLYANKGTIKALKAKMFKEKIWQFKKFKIGAEFEVKAFDLDHDVENLGFYIKHLPSSKTVVFATDTRTIKYNFKCNLLMIECNYDDMTLVKNAELRGFNNKAFFTHFELDKASVYVSQQEFEKLLLLHLSSVNLNIEYIKERFKNYTIAEKGVIIEF